MNYSMNLSNKLRNIVINTKDLTEKGYYRFDEKKGIIPSEKRETYITSIIKSKGFAIFTELKFSSPTTLINLTPSLSKAKTIIESFVSAGSDGLSILTEPTYFKGSLQYLDDAATVFPEIPILMKDFIMYPVQIDAAKILGASTILLIVKIQSKSNILDLIDYAHHQNLEVLLEVNNAKEMEWALDTKTDIIGINNRNLDTFQIDISLTERLQKRFPYANKPIISLSGIKTIEEVNNIKNAGVQGILIGTLLSNSNNPSKIIQQLKLV